MDYFDSIKLYHSFVSFSTINQTFYISLWNGILRDGIIDDIDITFFEDKHPTIFNHSILINEKFFPLSILQFNFLSKFFTD
jgi:hypothetical protein